jgi:hypothetical protein
LVVLWNPDWTFHSPILTEGVNAGGGTEDAVLPSVGVDVRLPVEEVPILYDCDILVRPKKELAAASILTCVVI